MARTLPKVLSADAVNQVLRTFNTKCVSGLRNRVMVECMYQAGLRVGEVVGLRVGEVNLTERLFELHHTKGGHHRNIPIAERLFPWLQLWDRERAKGNDFFFHTNKGKPVMTRYVRCIVDRAAKKAGLDPKQVHPHTFRHTFATELSEEGFNVQEVQELLGHASLSSTEVYLHVRPEKLRAKINGRHKRKQVDALLAGLSEDGVADLKKALAELEAK